MRRFIFISLILCSSMGLSGCVLDGGMPNLTEEETVLISEYAAGLALKYDKYHKTDLLDDVGYVLAEREETKALEREASVRAAAQKYLDAKGIQEQKEEEPANPETAGDGTQGTEMPVSDAIGIDAMAGFFGLDGFSFGFNGYELTASYPPEDRDDFFMAVESERGKQLCILKFNVTNISGGDAEFDMFARNPDFSAVINGKTVKVSPSLLLDDLTSYKEIIGAGESREMVLLFEIAGDILSADSINLKLSANGATGTVKLL